MLIEAWSLDRVTVLFAWLVWPWPLLVASVLVVRLLNRDEQIAQGPVADVFRYLTGNSVASFFGYGAVFALAGVGAVACSVAVHRVVGSEADPPVER